MANDPSAVIAGVGFAHTFEWCCGFYEYYQIDADNDNDPSEESEPTADGESGGYVKSANSPFGTIWAIAQATGWTADYILWKIPFACLQLMIADAPRYISGNRRRTLESEDALKDFLK